ncbi:relA/SpoT family protein [Orientia chuto str. Dubai]|uniref:GTP pyrophosphokinase rsh n=1 Tax=Orientia chuto str. Dubai TaxID=1359168 RepID=A0A0F3MJU8_9RICK|nr:RelA/SpoT family protein [Candidatus Orientia mediorientalis]KJV56025.1 relA/SpoT family protein [Orientia chuto str. Dubai]
MVDREDIINQLSSYDLTFDKNLVNKAIDYAIHYHGKQLRQSGEPYYYHPLHVALIIAKMKLDTVSVIAALLHDTVEDTELTISEIEHEFGQEVSVLVNGLTKLTKIQFSSYYTKQAKNFRKLLTAISNDIRVLIIKLADRLHNMRTIDSIKQLNKRIRIALETMEIYAPLAERIGVQSIKLELQDLAFKVMYPQIRDAIINKIAQYNDNNCITSDSIITEIQNTLIDAGIKAEVYGRHKAPYSIWIKMRQKCVGLDQLSDLMAFRVIVSTIPECYQVLGAIHSKYKTIPGSFQDFISIPKDNGYQSIHTTIIGPQQKKTEVQIRTMKMHEISELGVAAHWQYKQHENNIDQHKWILELLNILEQSYSNQEFLQDTKLAMYYDQVVCFTPEGKLISLPKGATVIDFAYKIHSELGNKCIGAKISNKIIPLDQQLQNGDQVEIITSHTQLPTFRWTTFAITGKAQSEIRKFICNQSYIKYVNLGKKMLIQTLKKIQVININVCITKIIQKLNKKNAEEIFFLIGSRLLTIEKIIKIVASIPDLVTLNKSYYLNDKLSPITISDNKIDDKINNFPISFAKCCYPLPGDLIVGIFLQGRIIIHTTFCTVASTSSIVDSTARLLDLNWSSNAKNICYTSSLQLSLHNKISSLSSITTKLEKNNINISNIKTNNCTQNVVQIIIDIEISTVEQLNMIINMLQSYQEIVTVERLSI